MGEYGGAGGVAAHHRVPSVDVAGTSQGIELDSKDVRVRSTSLSLHKLFCS